MGCSQAKGGGILVSATRTNKAGCLSRAGWQNGALVQQKKKWRVKYLNTLNSVAPCGVSMEGTGQHMLYSVQIVGGKKKN